MTSASGVAVTREEIAGHVRGVEFDQNIDQWLHIDEYGNYLQLSTKDFDEHPLWGGMRRCTLADDGTVNHYGSNPRGDGLTLDGTDGQVMVEIPKIFAKSLSPAANVYQWWFSDIPIPGFEVDPAWLMRGGIERDNIYYAAYEAHWNAGTAKLESITGATVDNNKKIATFRTNAEARGPRWGITNIWSLSAVQLLYYIEYANANSQTQIGAGITNGIAGQLTGLDNADTNIGVNGTGTGDGAEDDKTPAVYRGIENLWGNYWTFVDGYNALDTEYRIIRRDGTGIFQDVLAYGDYEVSVAVPYTVSDNYIVNIEYEDLLKYLFVTDGTIAGASSTTYLCDYWYAHDAAEVNLLISSGNWAAAGRAGVAGRSSWSVLTYADASVGGRLEFT